jgi:hypothetical protein
VFTAQARAMTREGWTDFSMSRTIEHDIETRNFRLAGEGATWRRRCGVASVGATFAATAVLGSLMLTSHQGASAAAPVSAAGVTAGLGFDDPPVPTGAPEMPMDMPGMDMSGGSSPEPPPPAEMPQDMPGMDMGGGSSPEPTIPAPMPPDMPGMDMTGDSHGHDDATGASGHRPLTPVLGTFGGATSAVLLTAGMMRRKDRAASLVKKASRIAGRAKK